MRVMTSGGRSQEVKASTGELIRDNISARRFVSLKKRTCASLTLTFKELGRRSRQIRSTAQMSSIETKKNEIKIWKPKPVLGNRLLRLSLSLVFLVLGLFVLLVSLSAPLWARCLDYLRTRTNGTSNNISWIRDIFHQGSGFFFFLLLCRNNFPFSSFCYSLRSLDHHLFLIKFLLT